VGRRKPARTTTKARRPATSAETRELELASQAYDLAEEQIQEGNASSQVITHFLKMGSSRERLEQARIAHENELLQVKREAIEGQKRVEELYMAALEAMRSYAGNAPAQDDVEE
jgi:hypothetical protein